MNIAEQALFLLDLAPSILNRKKIQNFSDLEPVVQASLRPAPEPAEESAKPTLAAPSYSVASRMGRANYDDQARAEALMNALQKLRANHKNRLGQGLNATRVIRES